MKSFDEACIDELRGTCKVLAQFLGDGGRGVKYASDTEQDAGCDGWILDQFLKSY